MSARHSEVFIDHFGDLSATKESIFLLSLRLFQVDLLLNVRDEEDFFFFSAVGDPLAKPTRTWTSSYLRHRCHPCLLQGLSTRLRIHHFPPPSFDVKAQLPAHFCEETLTISVFGQSSYALVLWKATPQILETNLPLYSVMAILAKPQTLNPCCVSPSCLHSRPHSLSRIIQRFGASDLLCTRAHNVSEAPAGCLGNLQEASTMLDHCGFVGRPSWGKTRSVRG